MKSVEMILRTTILPGVKSVQASAFFLQTVYCSYGRPYHETGKGFLVVLADFRRTPTKYVLRMCL